MVNNGDKHYALIFSKNRLYTISLLNFYINSIHLCISVEKTHNLFHFSFCSHLYLDYNVWVKWFQGSCQLWRHSHLPVFRNWLVVCLPLHSLQRSDNDFFQHWGLAVMRSRAPEIRKKSVPTRYSSNQH